MAERNADSFLRLRGAGYKIPSSLLGFPSLLLSGASWLFPNLPHPSTQHGLQNRVFTHLSHVSPSLPTKNLKRSKEGPSKRLSRISQTGENQHSMNLWMCGPGESDSQGQKEGPPRLGRVKGKLVFTSHSVNSGR